MKQEIIIISVGGSLIVPEKPDAHFLMDFKNLIQKHLHDGKRFIIITGGGKTARNYQDAARQVGSHSDEDMDWLGIHATRLNAHLMRAIFRNDAHPELIKDPTKKINFTEKILVAAGWKPGWSTDYIAALLAKNFKVKKIINLSNIDFAYDQDPRTSKDAKPLTNTNWKNFRKIVGSKWSPGLSAPFDPIASKECEKSKITVYILNGKNMQNIDKLISGKDFVGTTIR